MPHAKRGPVFVKALLYQLRRRLGSDLRLLLYLLRKGRFRKLRNFLWARLSVRDVGGGLSDFVYRAWPRWAPFPREVEIEITTRCHMRCIFCENTHWKNPAYRKQDILYDDFVRLCEQFPDLRYVGVMGEGTCWLNRDFLRILAYLDKRGIYTNFAESFDLFNASRIQQILPLDVARIEVSLDAARPETYETLKVGAQWDRTIQNLRTLREYKLKAGTPFPQIYFRYVVTSLNLSQIPDYVDLIADLDVNCGYATGIQFCGLLTFEENRHLDVAQIPPDIIAEADRRAARRQNIWIGWAHTKNSFPPIQTCAKWLQPYVMVDGEVLIDCAVFMANNRDFLRRNSFGSVHASSMPTIWNSPRYREARASVNRKSGPIHILCKDCRSVDTSARQTRYGVFGELV